MAAASADEYVLDTPTVRAFIAGVRAAIAGEASPEAACDAIRPAFSRLLADRDWLAPEYARDDAVIHLWTADDEAWRSRSAADERPVRSGAESFLAGTASCRIETADVDGLYAELEPAGVLHRASVDGVDDTDFGTREFATVDLDGNLITFFRWSA